MSTNTIGRANLDGTGVNQNFITGAPAGTRDLRGRGRRQQRLLGQLGHPAIGRANLDGTGVNQNFITGASYPNGVAIDN